jgi:S1-C subfamily serine protease
MKKAISILAACFMLLGIVSCSNINLKRGSDFLPRESYIFVKKIVNLKKCTGDECEEGEFTSVGSGFVVDITFEGSYVMTASHVCKTNPDQFLEGTEINSKLQVETLDGREYDAIVLKHNPLIDACLMYVEHLVVNIEKVTLAPEIPKEGDKVYNIASPYGIHFKNVVPIFEGRYAGQRGDRAFYTFPAGPGSSGSMILNDRGELIGLLHSVYRRMNEIVVSVAYDDLIHFISTGVLEHKSKNQPNLERIRLPGEKFSIPF